MINVSLLIDELNEQILSDQFTYLDFLGGGGYGNVVKAQSKELNKVVAIKIMERNKNKAQDEEAQLLEMCQHQNIVHFYKLIYTHNHLYLIMEYLSGITLTEVMQRNLKEKKIRNLIRQILQGLSYLHGKAIIHRDLKPSNILLVRENNKTIVKLIDFGLSQDVSAHKTANRQCGTLLYMAPELAQDISYNFTIDIFALGIIMYQLFHNGQHPFYKQGMKGSEYYKRLATLKFDLHFKEDLPIMAKDFIIKTIALNSNDRMSAYQCLDHPWIKNKDEQQYPITTNEIIQTFVVKQQFIKIIKALMFHTILVKLSHRKPQLQTEYHEIDSIIYKMPISQREKPPIYRSKMLKTVQGTFNTPQMTKRQPSRQSLAMSFIGSTLSLPQHDKRSLKTPSPPTFRLPAINKQAQSPGTPAIINKSRFFQH